MYWYLCVFDVVCLFVCLFLTRVFAYVFHRKCCEGHGPKRPARGWQVALIVGLIIMEVHLILFTQYSAAGVELLCCWVRPSDKY